MRSLLALVVSIGLSGCIIANLDIGALSGPGPLKEVLVRGEAGPKLVMVEIEGMIADVRQRITFTEEPSMVTRRLTARATRWIAC